MSGSIGFNNTYQISPVFLTGGIATGVSGGVMPIVSLLGIPGAFIFQPLPGSTMIDNAIGEYPFANQSVAANAIISQPLTVSMEMICPADSDMPYSQKSQIMAALQSALAQHNQSGGLYTVVTVSYTWTSTILRRMVDISTGETHQRQLRWQLDFRQPLVTLAQAQMAQNTQLSKINSGVQTNGASSGPNATTGWPPIQQGQGALG